MSWNSDTQYSCLECGSKDVGDYEGIHCCNNCGYLFENFKIVVDEMCKSDHNHYARFTESRAQQFEAFLVINYGKHKDIARILKLGINYASRFKLATDLQKEPDYAKMARKILEYVEGDLIMRGDAITRKIVEIDSSTIFCVSDFDVEKLYLCCRKSLDCCVTVNATTNKNVTEELKDKLANTIVNDFSAYLRIVRCANNSPVCTIAALVHFILKDVNGFRVDSKSLSGFFSISEGNMSNIKRKFVILQKLGKHQFGSSKEINNQVAEYKLDH